MDGSFVDLLFGRVVEYVSVLIERVTKARGFFFSFSRETFDMWPVAAASPWRVVRLRPILTPLHDPTPNGAHPTPA